MHKKLVFYPSSWLRNTCDEINLIDDKILSVAKEMVDLVLDAKAAGLAAPQMGLLKRMIVINSGDPLGYSDRRKPTVMINPRINEKSEQKEKYYEGCLSLPGGFAEVERPDYLLVSYIRLDGQEAIVEASAANNPLYSACLQHEIEHLDGKLFIDHLSRTKRDIVTRSTKKEMRHIKKMRG